MEKQNMTSLLHRCLTSFSAALVLSGIAFDASAQQSPSMPESQMNMSGQHMDMSGSVGAAASPSSSAYRNNARKMMKNMMAQPYTGNADVDFVAHMIPHHQGAIDQAEVELKYGKDAQMRALAASIVKAQRQEIIGMRKWQRSHAAN
jgi:uncharacterized protein (DUF305 family)